MSIRKSVIERKQLDPDTILVAAATKNDEVYYFSDLLNLMLFENMEHPPYSVWAYVSAAVPQEHRLLLPDMSEIVSHAARIDRHAARSVCRGCRPSICRKKCRAPRSTSIGDSSQRNSMHPAAIRRNGPTTSPPPRSGRC